MTKKYNTGLGKGLGALLPSTIEFSDKGFKFKALEPEEEETHGIIHLIDVSKIIRNPYQPRREFDHDELESLKNSIVEHGLITAISVRRALNGYEIIAGERRLRAVILAGLSKIPAYVQEDVTDLQMLEQAMEENLQRKDLNPIEEANGYNILIEECGLTQEQVARKFQKDRSTITNYLRLLKLPETIQESLRKQEISMGHARSLLALPDFKLMQLAWKEIIDKDLSVRAVETLVRDVLSGKVMLGQQASKKQTVKSKSSKPNVSPEVALILEDNENKLRHTYGTKVRINPKNEESGTIEFEFYTKDDLVRLLDLFHSASE